MSSSAPMIEIFSGIQGEGPRAGLRTLFLRFRGCNRECRYCDANPGTETLARIEQIPGQRDFRQRPSLMTAQEISEEIVRLHRLRPGHVDVSLTGGEPLLHAALLLDILPPLPSLGLRRYLETNGTLPEALASVIDHLDTVCMDIKLESATGESTPWEAHREFLRIATQRPLIVKIVVSNSTPDSELREACELLRTTPDVETVIQPLTGEEGPVVGPQRLIEMADLCHQEGLIARVLPQIHKILRDL